MKRTLLQPKRHLGSRVGTVLLAASLLAGPGLASPASAVEPTPTVRPTATSTPAAKPSPSATTSPAPAAQAAGAPAAAKATSTDYRTAMAAAAGPGGAEMGQGLRSSDAPSRLRTEAGALATEGTWTPTFGVQGLDVSNYQATVNWQTQWDLGARFAYIKATEGNYYTSPAFRAQFQGSRGVGMLRGAYHFANPAASSGADQARIFVNGGGVWSPDGYTLPPVLDFEANPYAGQTIGGYYQGNTCYDMSPTQLTTWVRDFGQNHAVPDGAVARHLHQHLVVEAVHRGRHRLRRLPAVDRVLAQFCQQLRWPPSVGLAELQLLAVQRVRPLCRRLECLERQLCGPAHFRAEQRAAGRAGRDCRVHVVVVGDGFCDVGDHVRPAWRRLFPGVCQGRGHVVPGDRRAAEPAGTDP